MLKRLIKFYPKAYPMEAFSNAHTDERRGGILSGYSMPPSDRLYSDYGIPKLPPYRKR